jgi:hypothetical protein
MFQHESAKVLPHCFRVNGYMEPATLQRLLADFSEQSYMMHLQARIANRTRKIRDRESSEYYDVKPTGRCFSGGPMAMINFHQNNMQRSTQDKIFTHARAQPDIKLLSSPSSPK